MTTRDLLWYLVWRCDVAEAVLSKTKLVKRVYLTDLEFARGMASI